MWVGIGGGVWPAYPSLKMGDWSKGKESAKMYSRDPLETEHASQRGQLG